MKDFTDEDYLIAVGDPSVIAMAAAVAGEFNLGRFKLLKYDGRAKDYLVVAVDLHRQRTLALKEEVVNG
jgi:hypothetical protein